DLVVGQLIAELERLGVYDRALVILLSDHGEGLGDHGEEEHGVLLYREAIQVPLLLKLPGSRDAGATVTAPAQLTDVAPTVASLVGLERPASWHGTPLLSLLATTGAPRPIYSETFYPRLHFGLSELASLIDGEHHLVSGPTPELFDLRADPGEKRDVLRTERRLYSAW